MGAVRQGGAGDGAQDLVEQPRLADARLALEVDDAALAVLCALPRVLERLELRAVKGSARSTRV